MLIALEKCKSKQELLAGALLLREITVSAPKLFMIEIQEKQKKLEEFIQTIMKDREAAFRHAGKLFLESFLNIVERKEKTRWFRKLYDNAKSTISKGLRVRSSACMWRC